MGLLAAAPPEPTPGVTYHVDCNAGNDVWSGTRPDRAWKTLAKVSATVFRPGDSILLRRNTTCAGVLWPKGSGSAARPITLGAYGAGPLPIVDGAGERAGMRLFNQEYWEIKNLDVRNSEQYGIWISGDAGVLHHLYLSDLVAHHVEGSLQRKDSGTVVVSTGGVGQIFDDVVIDGVRGHHTTQWAGILVNALNSESATSRPQNRNVRITSSVAHDVYGDGIVIFRAQNAVIEGSAVWSTGLQPRETIGTPNGLWTFECAHCVVQFNEGYWTRSPGVDGGVFDIDYGSTDSVVQHNYGHDADGYCVGVFAAQGPTRDAVVRDNVCIDNARLARLAFQGDFYVKAFDGGIVDGLQVHHNTHIWNPSHPTAAVQDFGAYAQPARVFGNLFRSSVPPFLRATAGLSLDYNVYSFTGEGSPSWTYGGQTYDSFESYQRGSRQDRHGVYAAPQRRSGDAGAAEYIPGGETAALPREVVQGCDALPALVAIIDSRDPARRDTSRSQAVFALSQAQQYGSRRLCVTLVDAGIPAGSASESEALMNLKGDWGLDSLRVVSGAPGEGFLNRTYLIDRSGRVLASFGGRTSPAVMGPALRSVLGRPGSSSGGPPSS